MKRNIKILSLIIAAAMAFAVMPAALAVEPGDLAVQTVTMPANDISGRAIYLSDVSVDVTFDGYLGQMPASYFFDWAYQSDKVVILKEGSSINFKINSSNPAAWYNHSYAEKDFMDDCGGGTVFYYSDGEFDGFPIFLHGNGDGTVRSTAGAMVSNAVFGRKTGEGEYSYPAQNGLYSYYFQTHKDYDDGGMLPSGGYRICYALTLNDTQLQELKATGAMTFFKGLQMEHFAIYPGVARALGFNDSFVQADFTSSKVLVNGVETSFEAYHINDNNYFKLRDIAAVVSGTEKQFEVTWDGSKDAISLISGQPYTIVGGELAPGLRTTKDAVSCTSTIYKDGSVVDLKAYTVNDNNYFKLRDLGQAFDFDVTWDEANNCVLIDTSSSYTAD